MTDTVLVERADNVATVILNRPEKLNAFTKAMWKRLGEVLAELSGDDAVRCIVLRGAGDRAFSPGNDISEFAAERSNAAQAEAYGELMHGTVETLRSYRTPTMAMIKGVCVGGGLEVAGLCDIRICGESSRFGAPISKLGLVMAYPEIRCLRDLVGPQVALEILLEGRIFDAAEALQKGLVSRIVPDDEVEAETMATAQRIADGAPLVHRWHKKFLDRLADPAPLTDEELKEAYACFDTEDFKTGYTAFLEKKKPEFKGR
ncbi:MAG: enoyl-CoA hydratase-related protein [Rhodospirillales bacterium]